MAIVNLSGYDYDTDSELMGRGAIKKAVQKVKAKIAKAPKGKKVLAAMLLGPLAPMTAAKIGTGIAAKKLITKAVKKSPRLQKTIANFKKLPLKKKIALIATGGLLAPLAPVLLPTVAAAATGAAGIVATKKAAQKIAVLRRNAQARNAAAAAASPDTVTDGETEKITIPVSARTEAGNVAAVNEAAQAEPETDTPETVKKPGSVLKWLAPLAALPFFFGDM